MELLHYARIARRRWRFIAGSVLVAFLVGAAMFFQATPQYASSARVFVSTNPSNSTDAYQGGLFSQQRLTSYADLLQGSELAQRVVDDLDLDVTPGALSEKIQATVVPQTVVLRISVTDADPDRAQLINQSVVQELTQLIGELETPRGSERPLLTASVVETPSLPTSPVSPQPLRYFGIALFLGLLVGCVAALLRDLNDTTIKDAEQAAELAKAPLLGTIPAEKDMSNHPLIVELSPHASRVEAFRVLRTNVSFVGVDGEGKTLVVTSSLPSEGKSTVATNLAVSLAATHGRVLLVDADLRRPQVARLMGLEQSVGLTTVLVGKLELDDAVQRHELTGLDVLTSGQIPPNPAELLESNAMAKVLAAARQEYEVVVIDSPPLLPVTDASVIAAQTGGALVVARHGRTTQAQLKDAAARLTGAGAQALGVVLNMTPDTRSSTSFSYGYAPTTENPVSRLSS